MLAGIPQSAHVPARPEHPALTELGGDDGARRRSIDRDHAGAQSGQRPCARPSRRPTTSRTRSPRGDGLALDARPAAAAAAGEPQPREPDPEQRAAPLPDERRAASGPHASSASAHLGGRVARAGERGGELVVLGLGALRRREPRRARSRGGARTGGGAGARPTTRPRAARDRRRARRAATSVRARPLQRPADRVAHRSPVPAVDATQRIIARRLAEPTAALRSSTEWVQGSDRCPRRRRRRVDPPSLPREPRARRLPRRRGRDGRRRARGGRRGAGRRSCCSTCCSGRRTRRRCSTSCAAPVSRSRSLTGTADAGRARAPRADGAREAVRAVALVGASRDVDGSVNSSAP